MTIFGDRHFPRLSACLQDEKNISYSFTQERESSEITRDQTDNFHGEKRDKS